MKRIAYLAWGVGVLLLAFAALAIKAPEIQSDVDARSDLAAASYANHPIAVETDGRDVQLSGYADTGSEREKIIEAVEDLWGARSVSAEIEVLPRLAAYPLTVRFVREGETTVTGAAPSVAGREALKTGLRGAFGPDTRVDLELASGAPARWRERAAAAYAVLAMLDRGELEIAGETVSLRGATRSEAALAKARAAAVAAGAAEGMPWSIDLSLIKPEIRPFTLEAEKNGGGGITVSGYASDPDARAAIAQAATDLALGAPSAAEITLAEGLPGPDWAGLAIRRMGGLASLARGRLEVSDYDAYLTGEAETLDAAFAAEEALRAADAQTGQPGVGQTVFDVSLLDYRLTASSDADRRLQLRGAAPDEATAQTIADAARDIFGQDADIRFVIAHGEAPSWSERAELGLNALARLDRGSMTLAGAEGRLSGISASEATLKAIERDIEDGTDEATPWSLDLSFEPPLLSPFPLDVTKSDEGAVAIGGAAPSDEARQELRRAARALGGFSEPTDVLLARREPGGESDTDWVARALTAIPLLEPLESGKLEIRDDRVLIEGVVATPEEADAVREAVTAALGEDATTRLSPRDPRRASSLALSLDLADKARLEGRLPEGLSVEDATRLLGLGSAAVESTLQTGGRGDAERWRAGLGQIGEFLPEFERLSLQLEDRDATLDGELVAASDVNQVRRFLRDGLGEEFRTTLTVEPSAASFEPGATRVNALTGRREVFRGGYWLPEVAIGAPSECARASDLVLLDNTIRFLLGSAELDVRARRLVNELSAIAEACLTPDSELTLLIGGHTDSTGGDDMNMALSEKRAQAVLDALVSRGVSPEAMRAVGFGETQPVMSNDTEEGRAANRRISFEWLDKAAPEPTGSDQTEPEATAAEPASTTDETSAAQEAPAQNAPAQDTPASGAAQ